MEPQRDKYGRFVPTGTDGPDVPDFVDVDDLGGSGSAKLTLSNEHSELTHDEILRLMGLSVAEWEIAGVNRRKTYMADGRVSRSLSVRVKRRDIPLASGAIDMDEVRELLDAWVFEPPNPPKRPGQAPSNTFVLAFADWQIGGAVPGTPEVPGRGTKDTVERIKGAIDAAVVRVHELRSLGRNIPFLAIPSLGDLVESCQGFYGSQLFTVDMNDRDQLRTGWALVLYALRKLAPLFERVDIYPVGGNHGENNRVRGRQQTTPDDNRDLLVFDVVDTTVQESHHLSNVTVHMPRNPLYAVHELSGVNLAITHGHLFNGGANAAAKAERWWKNQAFGQNSNLDSANILLSGHFHSFAAATFTEEGRVWLQCPAEDNGSQWFTDMSGLSSPPGMLSFVVGPAYGAMRYGDLQIL